jgi:hypothetical protein
VVLLSGPGGWVIVFSHSSHPNHELDWPPLAELNPTPLHESWPSTKSSSSGKSYSFHSSSKSGAHRSQKVTCKSLESKIRPRSVQSV